MSNLTKVTQAAVMVLCVMSAVYCADDSSVQGIEICCIVVIKMIRNLT